MKKFGTPIGAGPGSASEKVGLPSVGLAVGLAQAGVLRAPCRSRPWPSSPRRPWPSWQPRPELEPCASLPVVACWACWPACGSCVGLACRVGAGLPLPEDDGDDGDCCRRARWARCRCCRRWGRPGPGRAGVGAASARGAGCGGGVMSWTLAIGARHAGDLDLVGRRAGRHVDGHRDLRAADERDEQRALLGRGRHRRGAEAGEEEAGRRQTDEQLALVHAKTRRPWGRQAA